MFIPLSDAKHHLNIDSSFKLDDEYIIMLIQAAESAVAKHTNRNLKDCVNSNGEFEPTLRQAILLLVGNWYSNRESEVFSTPKSLDHAYEFLISLNKNYAVP